MNAWKFLGPLVRSKAKSNPINGLSCGARTSLDAFHDGHNEFVTGVSLNARAVVTEAIHSSLPKTEYVGEDHCIILYVIELKEFGAGVAERHVI